MIRRALLWLVVMLPLIVGVIAGFCVRLWVLWVAAAAQGYQIGRGA